MRSTPPICLALGLLLSGACSDDDPPTVLVDLRTDWRPGFEFASVRTEAGPTDGSETDRTDSLDVDESVGDGFLTGLRVAEVSGIPDGDVRVRVTLFRADGSVLAEQPVRFEHRGTSGITVVITRDCASVTCPAAGGAPAMAACLGGACVDEACRPDNSDVCPAAACTGDPDCGAGLATCGAGRCVDGRCFATADDSSCPGSWCDPTSGCTGTPPPDDAGLDAGADMDAGPPDAGSESCAPITAFTTGGFYTCAITDTGRLYCWGWDGEGQLGVGGSCTSTACRNPLPLPVGTEVWSSVTGHWKHTCAVKPNGEAWCWGDNSDQQIGSGHPPRIAAPVRIGADEDWRLFGTGRGTHTCALRGTDRLWCWGANDFEQVEAGMSTTVSAPTLLSLGMRWAAVAPGGHHTCALEDGGALFCWGRNGNGQAGVGSTMSIARPLTVMGPPNWSAVSSGLAHTCGISDAGALYCWGWNADGQLGTGSGGDVLAPMIVDGSGSWLDVAAGEEHTCALRSGGRVFCFGDNEWGQSGLPPGTPAPSRVMLPMGGIVDVSLGHDHSCALQGDGTLWCWGRATAGQLGVGIEGDAASTNAPQRVCIPAG